MTYCLAIKLNSGIVFAADTRTNAGVDYVASYRKLHEFRDLGDRVFVLLTAGNLAISQEICEWLQRDLNSNDGRESLRSFQYPFEVADYVGRTSRTVQDRHRQALTASGVSVGATLILGGQIQGQPHEIFLIYSQGNFMQASADTPYLQIGESKYGKPMLDRLVSADLPLSDAARLALVSLDATIRSNLTVGLPVDLAIYDVAAARVVEELRLDDSSDYLTRLRDGWQAGLENAFQALPPFEWEAEST